jgi:hypothetical protein
VGAAEAFGGLQQYHFSYPSRILCHLAVPEANHRPSLAFQPPRSPRVGLAVRMLTAIHFHR